MMKHLTLAQRYEIEALKKQNFSQAHIARAIGRDRSVVSREIRRNSDQRNGEYRAELAQRKADERHRDKPKLARFTETVKIFVESLLEKDFSPEQVAGIAKKDGITCVSHERIYQHVWKDKKNGGKIYQHLRTGGKKYRKRGAKKDKRGQITGRVGIAERPAVVAEKARVGDLEMDLVIGKGHQGALLTINDRATGVLRMKKLDGKGAEGVRDAALGLLGGAPNLHTITTDNGKEFANHADIAAALGIDHYFATPYHSWERGANENLNGLVRQYFPKKMDFGEITDERVAEVENILNNRPRKRYGFQTPNEVHAKAMANGGNVAFVT
jgi:transposase, IS30 family